MRRTYGIVANSAIRVYNTSLVSAKETKTLKRVQLLDFKLP